MAGNGAADALAALQDFDGISYAKGAAVLKQLAAYLGDEVFFAGLRDYFERHALRQRRLRRPDRRLDPGGRARTWTPGPRRGCAPSGLDTLTVDRVGQLRRAPHAGPNVRRPHTVQVGELRRGPGRSWAEQPSPSPSRWLRSSVHPRAALVVPDADDETWAKIRFGDRTWPQVFAVARRHQVAGHPGGDRQRGPRTRSATASWTLGWP